MFKKYYCPIGMHVWETSCYGRRYLMAQGDEEIKLLLESFQMSVAACLAHPQVSMLHCQMSGRLIAARQAGYLKVSSHSERQRLF